MQHMYKLHFLFLSNSLTAPSQFPCLDLSDLPDLLTEKRPRAQFFPLPSLTKLTTSVIHPVS